MICSIIEITVVLLLLLLLRAQLRRAQLRRLSLEYDECLVERSPMHLC